MERKEKMVQYKVTKRDEQPVSGWPGGVTRQFYIYPEGSEGATSFDYDFEITSSTMDYPETEYTRSIQSIRIMTEF